MQDSPISPHWQLNSKQDANPLAGRRATPPTPACTVLFCGPDEQSQTIEKACLQTTAQSRRVHTFEEMLQFVANSNKDELLLCVIDVFELRNGDLASLSNALGKNAFCRILVLSELNLINNQRIKHHAGMPVRFIPLPVDHVGIQEHIESFRASSVRLSNYLRQVSRLDDLDKREQSLALMIASGAPNKKSARMLGLAEKTVEKCRAKIYDKLGVSSTAELTALVTIREHYRWPAEVPYPERLKRQ